MFYVTISGICPVIDLEFFCNIGKVAVDPQTTFIHNVMTKFIVNNRTEA